MMRYLSILFLSAVLVVVQGCAVMGGAGDRRSAGAKIEDDTIEAKATERIQDKYRDNSRVTVTSYNRFVLITGEALNNVTKTEIERIVYSIPNVKKIADEVVVGALASSSSGRNDSGISSDIYHALNKSKSIQAGAVRVVTDKGIVYLLGLVPHAEADAASEIARTIPGVQRVVRIFEYID